MKNIRILVMAALLIAITCISTMLIKIPTPGFGYIHPGDGFVILCGLLLGPWAGALCAGIGSALADLFSGYLIYVPATFIIKALCALLAALILKRFLQLGSRPARIGGMILGGIVAEAVMVGGYFLYEAFIIGTTVGLFAALASVPFNIVQGVFGVLISSVIYPIVSPIYNRAISKNS